MIFLCLQSNAVVCAELKLGGKHSGIFWCASFKKKKKKVFDAGKLRVPT